MSQEGVFAEIRKGQTNEIHEPPQKYSLIDRQLLMTLLGIYNSDRLSKAYKGWVEDVLSRDGRDGHIRETKWTQSIAVGSKFFVEKVKDDLGFKAIGRKVVSTGDVYELKESEASYRSDFDGKMSTLRS
jgi:putative transposase